jgi:hypothetical protein
MEDGSLRTILPSNIEAFADDFAAIAGLAAARRLGYPISLGANIDVKEKLDEKQAQLATWFSGIAYGLHRDSIPVYQHISGWFGKGFYTVAHWCGEQRFGSCAGMLGAGATLQRAATGKAWSRDVHPSHSHIVALARRAAATQLFEEGNSWLLSKETFFSKGLKSSLPWDKVGIITPNEAKWLSLKYASEAKEWQNLCSKIDQKTQDISTVFSEIQRVGHELRPVGELVERITARRVKAIYPSNVKERGKARKRPIEELIAEMEPEAYLYAFNPCLLENAYALNVENVTRSKDLLDLADYIAKLEERFIAWQGTTQLSESLGALVQAWWRSIALPRLVQ